MMVVTEMMMLIMRKKNLFNDVKVFSNLSLLHHHFASNSVAWEHCLNLLVTIIMMVMVMDSIARKHDQKKTHDAILHESCSQRFITFDIASLSCSSKWLTRNYRFSTKRQTKGIFTSRRENSELYGWLDVNLSKMN